MTSHWSRAAAFFAVIAVTLAPALTPAAQASEIAQRMVADLNAQRAGNGIPGDVIEEATWSRQCELHMEYLRLNQTLEHDEDPGKPGYTEGGAIGGRSSVLSGGRGDFTGGHNPWELAPIHLAQVLHPALSRTGASAGCMSTWRGYERPEPAETIIYTYPGPGRTGVAFEQQTREIPFTPAELLGLGDQSTGPHLYVFPFGGAEQKATAATLTGSSGPVDVRLADQDTTDGSRRIGGYIPDSTTILIPPRPLRPETAYTATVTFSSGITHSWSFVTEQHENAVAIEFSRERQVTVSSAAPLLEAWIVDPSGKRLALTVDTGGRARFPGTPGRWQVCARSGGPGTGYVPVQRCETERVAAYWNVTMTKRRNQLTVKAFEYTRGRVATISWRRGYYRCPKRNRCAIRPEGPTTRKTVKLRASTRLTLPAYAAVKNSAVFVTIRIAAGRAYGQRVPAYELTRSFGRN